MSTSAYALRKVPHDRGQRLTSLSRPPGPSPLPSSAPLSLPSSAPLAPALHRSPAPAPALHRSPTPAPALLRAPLAPALLRSFAPVPKQIACLSFINVVIAFGPGKEEAFRIHMRTEIEDCGLSEYLEVRSHALPPASGTA